MLSATSSPNTGRLVFANVLAAAIGLPVPAMPTLVLFGAMSAMHPAMIGSQLVTVVVLGARRADRRHGGTSPAGASAARR